MTSPEMSPESPDTPPNHQQGYTNSNGTTQNHINKSPINRLSPTLNGETPPPEIGFHHSQQQHHQPQHQQTNFIATSLNQFVVNNNNNNPPTTGCKKSFCIEALLSKNQNIMDDMQSGHDSGYNGQDEDSIKRYNDLRDLNSSPDERMSR